MPEGGHWSTDAGGDGGAPQEAWKQFRSHLNAQQQQSGQQRSLVRLREAAIRGGCAGLTVRGGLHLLSAASRLLPHPKRCVLLRAVALAVLP